MFDHVPVVVSKISPGGYRNAQFFFSKMLSLLIRVLLRWLNEYSVLAL